VAEALGRTARYGRCSRRERQAISQAGRRREVPAGTVLARQGQPAREFAIVLTGGANVYTDGRLASALLAGDHFGDVALLGDGRSPATVVAETAMSLAVVPAGGFTALLERSPAVACAVVGSLAGRLRAGLRAA
jgi:CRP-like cAMP-binding protein